MAKYPCEMFGHFFYSPALTYEQLHALEGELWQQSDQILLEAGATHLDFNPGGDFLALQCEFAAYDNQLFEELAAKLAELLNPNIELRLLFVNKSSMEKINIYFISHNGIDEEEISLGQPTFEN